MWSIHQRLNPNLLHLFRALNKMYYKHPHENWFQKGIRIADQGLKIVGTAKGIYEVGSAIATGARAVAPMLALL